MEIICCGVWLSSMDDRLMTEEKELRVAERSLDPATEAEWAELRQLGHRMLDGMFDYMQDLRDGPVWRELPATTKAAFAAEAIPRAGAGAAVAYDSFLRDCPALRSGKYAPAVLGMVMGGGTPVGMLAEMLARE